MFDSSGRYVLKDYTSKAPFSSFLPGIAGELGIPLWCYYNNRGQAVCSFGARDKDHAIMEFSPAHVAYRDVSRTGFRTFCKVNGAYTELFTETSDMHIGMGELEITCCQLGLRASALYFGLPGERAAGLCRVLTLKNTTDQVLSMELLDGMSAVVPYGLNQDFLKNMTQLSKAWMQCEDHEKGQAYFRVRASLEDGAVVREVKGGNFCLGYSESGELLRPIVQPSLVFGQNTALSAADRFRQEPLSDLLGIPQVTSNQVLCCFLPRICQLNPGETMTVYSLYGQAENKAALTALQDKITSPDWFARKRTEVQELIRHLTAAIACKTADPVFDAYAKQTYLDNLLRGGSPSLFRSGERTVPFHLYSRKHGDPEREYNYFSLGQEYYAQGNGNYRDVNQNRRCDVLFAPEIGDYNIRTFFDLIQSDGYNPLVILPVTYQLPKKRQMTYTAQYPQLGGILSGDFTPGKLAMALEDCGLSDTEIQDLTARIICDSESEPNADFAEGYWTDHWTYNLDQIESYLSIYPEQKDALLFTEDTCRWYDTKVFVNPRGKRYATTENGLRQYYALDEAKKESTGKWMLTEDGTVARSSILEKILLLCAIKTATLDPYGMGIEMEGGRPGWYDALNGLPGLLGSSMAESCELARLLEFAMDALGSRTGSLSLYREISSLITSVASILESVSNPLSRWDVLNTCKEEYRLNTIHGYQGQRTQIPCSKLKDLLKRMHAAVLDGIARARTYTCGVIPAYFTFEAVDIVHTEEGPIPTAFRPTALPLFLEGPVRYLKLSISQEAKTELVRQVRASALYDRELKMYKVNESLKGVSYEAGRALAFTPGWLENESVWLHMEYKYLLELLKNGLYAEFAEAFRDAAIPFLNPDRYGRSPLENVSFIASSANPDPQIRGQGFVARLSGSTAEFLHIWQLLFFGADPFRYENGRLTLGFEPFVPGYLMPEDGLLEATFLGNIPVVYHTGDLRQLIPGKTVIQRYRLHRKDGSCQDITGTMLDQDAAAAVRSGQITKMEIWFA